MSSPVKIRQMTRADSVPSVFVVGRTAPLAIRTAHRRLIGLSSPRLSPYPRYELGSLDNEIAEKILYAYIEAGIPEQAPPPEEAPT